MIGNLRPWGEKNIKDFFDVVIDSLVPSTHRSQQASIFRTDGKVMIHSYN